MTAIAGSSFAAGPRSPANMASASLEARWAAASAAVASSTASAGPSSLSSVYANLDSRWDAMSRSSAPSHQPLPPGSLTHLAAAGQSQDTLDCLVRRAAADLNSLVGASTLASSLDRLQHGIEAMEAMEESQRDAFRSQMSPIVERLAAWLAEINSLRQACSASSDASSLPRRRLVQALRANLERCGALVQFQAYVISSFVADCRSLPAWEEDEGEDESMQAGSRGLDAAQTHASEVRHLADALELQDEMLRFVERAVRREARRIVEGNEHGSEASFCSAVNPLDTPLEAIRREVRRRVLGVAQLYLGSSTTRSAELWAQRIDYDVAVSYVNVCSSGIFDVIRAWPDCEDLLQNSLRPCIEMTGRRMHLADKLLEALHNRLLHPGAPTRSIIHFYVFLIRALRILDPTGVVLSHAITPVRTYLQSRPDTVPFIVASLLGNDSDFTLLRDELENEGRKRKEATAGAAVAANQFEEAGAEDDDEDEEGGGEEGLTADGAPLLRNWAEEGWTPRPVEAGREFRQSRAADVIGMLVGIFDDRKGFVRALERSTAESVIKIEGYDHHVEYTNNEIIKRRFGDAALGRCDIMLDDVVSSRRTDSAVHSLVTAAALQKELSSEDAELLAAIHPLVLSRQFWPPLEGVPPSSTLAKNALDLPPGGAHLKMPRRLDEALKKYNELFARCQATRRLVWLEGRGSVDVDIELDREGAPRGSGGGRHFTVKGCSPLDVAVLESFSEPADADGQGEPPASLGVQDLVQRTGVEAPWIRKAVEFWASQGALREMAGQAGRYEEARS